jgi:hypothetical protein
VLHVEPYNFLTAPVPQTLFLKLALCSDFGSVANSWPDKPDQPKNSAAGEKIRPIKKIPKEVNIIIFFFVKYSHCKIIPKIACFNEKLQFSAQYAFFSAKPNYKKVRPLFGPFLKICQKFSPRFFVPTQFFGNFCAVQPKFRPLDNTGFWCTVYCTTMYKQRQEN